MGWMGKIWTLFKSSPGDGTPYGGPLDRLKSCYRSQLYLAEQLQADAKSAAYPHVSVRLQEIAAEKRKTAASLREKIVGLGERVEEPSVELRTAKNQWERLSEAIRDQKALEMRLQECVWLIAEQAPEVSEFLRDLGRAEAGYKQILQDLLVRADPQATQT